MEYLTLHNGRRMPALGLGTWDLRGQTCVETIPRALELGYRLIDTAQMYENEREVGQGLRLAGLPREEVWVTTKIFRPDTTYAKAKAAIQRSLDQLALDYIDLLLIHEPYDTAEEMYVALEEAYQAGTLRAIGISNFHEARYLPGRLPGGSHGEPGGVPRLLPAEGLAAGHGRPRHRDPGLGPLHRGPAGPVL